MPTIITRGLGYDTPTIIVRSIGDAFNATLVIEDSFLAYLEVETPLCAYLTCEGGMEEDERIKMFLRDDRTLSLSINNSDNTPVDLTGAKLYFTVKQKMTDPDSSSIFQKKNTAAGGSDAEIKVIDAPGGSAEIYIIPSDTETTDPGNYMWDVQAVLANGKTYTVLRGRVTFKEDVTKEIG